MHQTFIIRSPGINWNWYYNVQFRTIPDPYNVAMIEGTATITHAWRIHKGDARLQFYHDDQEPEMYAGQPVMTHPETGKLHDRIDQYADGYRPA